MRFLRITWYRGIEHRHPFDAPSIPDAKKVCRKHWERTVEENKLVGYPVTVGLHQRNNLDGERGPCIAYVEGRFGENPRWIKGGDQR